MGRVVVDVLVQDEKVVPAQALVYLGEVVVHVPLRTDQVAERPSHVDENHVAVLYLRVGINVSLKRHPDFLLSTRSGGGSRCYNVYLKSFSARKLVVHPCP